MLHLQVAESRMSFNLETNPVDVIKKTQWILLAATKSQKGEKLSRCPTPDAEDTVEERQVTVNTEQPCSLNNR